jgi:hypothetical protein
MNQISTLANQSLPLQTPVQVVDQLGTKNAEKSAGFTRELEAVDQPKKPMEIAAGWRVSRKGAEVSSEVNDFSFSDFVDIINPLQHLPLIGDAYRAVTGDSIKPVSQVTGDILYAGATGGLSIVSSVIAIGQEAYKEANGETVLASMASAIIGGPNAEPATQPQIKLADTAPAPAAAPQTSVQTAALPNQTAAEPKLPFGGVIDSGAAQHAQRLASLQQGGASHITSVGNIIYNSPTFSRAARISAADLANKTSNPALQAGLAKPSLSIPGSSPVTSRNLGQLMQQNAKDTQNAGGQGSLPPNLVQDMMLMALDKYKSASGLAATELDVTP